MNIYFFDGNPFQINLLRNWFTQSTIFGRLGGWIRNILRLFYMCLTFVRCFQTFTVGKPGRSLGISPGVGGYESEFGSCLV